MFMKKYRRTKIGRKMIEILCVLTIPMLIICLLMTSNSKNTLEDGIINNYKNILKAASDQMSDRFRSIELLTVSLTLDDDLNKMCIVSDTQKGLVLYNAFQQRLYAYAACQQIDCNLSVWLPQQNRILSSQDYIYIPSDAKALIRSGESDMLKIAQAAGYEREYSLRRAFSRIEGIRLDERLSAFIHT